MNNMGYLTDSKWCGRRDLNPHGFVVLRILSPATRFSAIVLALSGLLLWQADESLFCLQSWQFGAKFGVSCLLRQHDGNVVMRSRTVLSTPHDSWAAEPKEGSAVA